MPGPAGVTQTSGVKLRGFYDFERLDLLQN